MLIRLTTKILVLAEKETFFQFGPENDKTDLTVRTVLMEALGAKYDDEKDLTIEQGMKRYELAVRIMKAGDKTDLSSEDYSLVKDVIAKRWGLPIYGFVLDLINKKEPTHG